MAQFKNLLPQLLHSYAGHIYGLNLESGDIVTDIPTGLYPEGDPSLLLFSNGKAISLSRVALIKIPGVTYNTSLTYLPDPPEGRDASCVGALHSLLTEGRDVRIRTGGLDTSGIVVKSACGLVVMTDQERRNLSFIPLCQVESITLS